MNCCLDCFTSPYLRNILERSDVRGNCDFCGSQNMKIVDARELFNNFRSILDIYVPSAQGIPLIERLNDDFTGKIFKSKDSGQIRGYLESILEVDLELYRDHLDGPVILGAVENAEVQKVIASLEETWPRFVEEIKFTNRFHISNLLALDRLGQALETIAVTLKAGKILYRGRISDRGGFDEARMWNPPSAEAVAGRANPRGISYLYLANNIDTTLLEVRASMHDYVTIAEFLLTEDVKIVDLKAIDNLDPFDLAESENLESYLTYLPFLRNLGAELSKPIRKGDSELDYLPTQYVTEFIKSRNFDGIGYGSSMNRDGRNFAFFGAEKFRAIRRTVHEITNLHFDSREHQSYPLEEYLLS